MCAYFEHWQLFILTILILNLPTFSHIFRLLSLSFQHLPPNYESFESANASSFIRSLPPYAIELAYLKMFAFLSSAFRSNFQLILNVQSEDF